MRTSQRTRTLATQSRRSMRPLLRPVAGQCFEIHLHDDAGRWTIRIPEIDGSTEASTRSAVESAARQFIAAHTGIPLGYISVWVRD